MGLVVRTTEQLNELFNKIIEDIENGSPLHKSIKANKTSNKTFYDMVDNDEERKKRYVRACELRADKLFEECLDIVDCEDNDVSIDRDGNERINNDVIARDRLRFDARRWMAGKLHPAKYSDKLVLQGDRDNPLVPLLNEQQINDKLIEKMEQLKELGLKND